MKSRGWAGWRTKHMSSLETVKQGLSFCPPMGIKVIIDTVVQLDLNWHYVEAWLIYNSVSSRGKKKCILNSKQSYQWKFGNQSILLLQITCVFIKILRLDSIMLAAVSTLPVLTQLVMNPKADFISMKTRISWFWNWKFSGRYICSAWISFSLFGSTATDSQIILNFDW